jgi:hypothetical protein
VTVKTEPLDRYTCALDAKDNRVNLMTIEPVNASVPFVIADLEVYACSICTPSFLVCVPPGDPLAANYLWEKIEERSFNIGSGSSECTCITQVYGRRRTTTICVGGNPVPPSGSGWALLENNCAIDGTATYVKRLSGDEIFFLDATLEEGECVDGVLQPPTGCVAYLPVYDCDAEVTGCTSVTGEIPYKWVCFGAAGIAHNRARTLQSAAEAIVEALGCPEITGIASDFFGWNAPGDAPGYVAGLNYVTGQPTQTEHLLIMQKSDAMDPDATNPATIGEMSFAELMNFLWVAYRCWWDITPEGVLRIEHFIYWQGQPGIDVSTVAGANEPLRYKHLNDEIPRIERALWMEAQSRDFVGLDIIYSGPCAKKDAIEQWEPGKITTDINFVNTDPEAIEKDGFVVLAADFNGVDQYSVIVDNGAITGNFAANAPLSWANLQRDFWQWDRYLPTGSMNGQPTNFMGYLPNIEQDDVSIPMCCGLSSFDARQYLTTKLGQRLGIQRGEVLSADHDLKTGRTTFVIRYAY